MKVADIRYSACMLCLVLVLVLALDGCGARKQPIVIRYAAWNLGDVESDGMERRMVRAFMERYPDIRIEIDERYVADYNAAMAKDAAAGTLPDVFMFAGTPEVERNGWCHDLDELVAADSEWNAVPTVLRDAATARGRIVAVPSAMHLFGYFCNLDRFEEAGVEAPQVGGSVAAFLKAVRAVNNPAAGRVGLADASQIAEWYPAAANPRFGWFSWDGGRFHLQSSFFRDGVETARRLNQEGCCYATLPEAERVRIAAGEWEAWTAGSVALKFDGTWAMDAWSKLPDEIAFAGIPGDRACIVPDFLFLSHATDHPQAAYAFARFMSAWSEEGFGRRIDFARTEGMTIPTLPMGLEASLVESFFEGVPMKGIREAYEQIGDTSHVECTKVLPGYEMARWLYPTNLMVGDRRNATIGEVIDGAMRGVVDYDDVASHLDAVANASIEVYPRTLGE